MAIPSHRFPYLSLDNVKNVLEPVFARNLFQNGYVEAPSLATRTLFSIVIPRVSFLLASIQRGSCILLSVDYSLKSYRCLFFTFFWFLLVTAISTSDHDLEPD